jgi:hypothetical protein
MFREAVGVYCENQRQNTLHSSCLSSLEVPQSAMYPDLFILLPPPPPLQEESQEHNLLIVN